MGLHFCEGEVIPKDLTPYWTEVNDEYRQITDAKLQYRCLRWLLEHIIDSGYSKALFPRTSLFDLLVSLPVDGKVDHARTLHIAYDEIGRLVSMQLKTWPDTDLLPEEIEKNSQWSMRCQPAEVIATFEHFLDQHSDWSHVARQT